MIKTLSTAHPFWHVSSIWIMVMILQNDNSGHDGHPNDDHYTGKVLTWAE